MNGTYTQRCRAQMAGGGIMGSNAGSMLVAPTADGSRPGYFGLDDIGDFLSSAKDKIVDDLIPNEIKDSPIGTALVGGALLNQFGIPFTGQFTQSGDPFGQNWLGNLLGKDLVLGPGGEQFPDYSNVTGVVNPNIGITGKQGVWSGDYEGDAYGTKSIADYIKEGAITTGKNVIDAAANKAGLGGWKDILFGPTKVCDQEVQWKLPLQIGTAIGAADYLTRSDDKMPAQLAIDPSRFATAEAAKADPN